MSEQRKEFEGRVRREVKKKSRKLKAEKLKQRARRLKR